MVPHAPQSVALVRRQVAADLRAAGAGDDAVDDVALVVSELVGNAVRHGAAAAGAGDVVLRVRARDGRVLRVEVDDAGDLPAVPPAPAPTAESGRGLLLVDQLASRWGAQSIPGGTRVWFEVTGGHEAADAGRVD